VRSRGWRALAYAACKQRRMLCNAPGREDRVELPVFLSPPTALHVLWSVCRCRGGGEMTPVTCLLPVYTTAYTLTRGHAGST
jgi:hypothetical protein